MTDRKINKLILVPKDRLDGYCKELKAAKVEYYKYKQISSTAMKDIWLSLELTKEQLHDWDFPKP